MAERQVVVGFKEVSMEKCFGYNEKTERCEVVHVNGLRELKRKYNNFCGTLYCPLYKPHREDIRLHDRIIERSK